MGYIKPRIWTSQKIDFQVPEVYDSKARRFLDKVLQGQGAAETILRGYGSTYLGNMGIMAKTTSMLKESHALPEKARYALLRDILYLSVIENEIEQSLKLARSPSGQELDTLYKSQKLREKMESEL